MRRCPKCRQTKPRDAFARNRARKDGLDSWCRECHRARYLGQLPPEVLAVRNCKECGGEFTPVRANHVFCSYACQYRQRDRQRYAADPEAERAKSRAYYAANREKKIAYVQGWQAENHERFAEYQAAYK